MCRGQSQGKRKKAEEESLEGESTSSSKRANEVNAEGASISSSISPEATGVGSGQYDVFLSFNGLDTRRKFTDHLYQNLVDRGIGVFKDDINIPPGVEFGSRIFDAITQSRILIPIISKNYTSNKWCLRELACIMHRKTSTSHIVLPIFYEVTPSDVRHLRGNFGDAFCSNREHFDEKDIQEWQQALREVSDLEGWESQKFANGHEGILIKHVVKTVTSNLEQYFQQDVPKQLVGLDDHLKEIMNHIDSSSINAQMIGIYGMGGIGKTTLAKCIFNQLLNKFDYVSFLSDVREIARRHGITHLQDKLILDILKYKNEVSSFHEGIKTIKSRFKGKKVLIVLDDIDHNEQLDALAGEPNWFGEGSLIIVTTRNKASLDKSEFEVDYMYKLNGLDKVQSLLLFNRHAFHRDYSPQDFEGISHDIISTMGGLPLALKVVGSSLYKEMDRKVWEEVWKRLKSQPCEEVEEILRISYDALKDEHKKIFLDTACFFIGRHSKFAMYMWEGCGFFPHSGIKELKSRCLIDIGDDGKFEMHDQLRDLGRSIFCKGQPLENRSRPWDGGYEGVPRVLRQLEPIGVCRN